MEDKFLNCNKNTIGTIEDFTSYFSKDEIYLSISFKNEKFKNEKFKNEKFKNEKFKNEFCFGQIWLQCIPILGLQRPFYIRINSKLYKKNIKDSKLNFSLQNNTINSKFNSLKDSIINITNSSIEKQIMELEYLSDFYNVISGDTTVHRIKLKTRINFNKKI